MKTEHFSSCHPPRLMSSLGLSGVRKRCGGKNTSVCTRMVSRVLYIACMVRLDNLKQQILNNKTFPQYEKQRNHRLFCCAPQKLIYSLHINTRRLIIKYLYTTPGTNIDNIQSDFIDSDVGVSRSKMGLNT